MVRAGNGIDDGTAAPEHVADEQPPAIAQASVSLEEEHVEVSLLLACIRCHLSRCAAA